MAGTQTLKCFLVFVPFFVLAVFSGSIYDDLRSNYFPATVPALKMALAGQGITAVIVSEEGFDSTEEEPIRRAY